MNTRLEDPEYAAGYAHGRYPWDKDGPANPSRAWLDGWDDGDRARYAAEEYAIEMACDEE